MFSITEGFKGIIKARLASTLSISSITLTIMLIGFFAIFIINLHSWMGFLREKIEIELFIETGSTVKEIEEVKQKVKQTSGIKKIEYISKELAAERFKNEFGQDVFEILEFNPFPPSIIIHLEEGFQNPEQIKKIKDRLELISNVDEVFYKRPLLVQIDRYIKFVYLFASLAGIIIVIIAMVLIFNTIRLTIYARKDMIYIMRLVGATEGFVRKPFLVEGMIQGLAGGILSSIIIYYGLQLIKTYIYPYLISQPLIYIGLLIFGMIIGVISAHLSVSRYLRII